MPDFESRLAQSSSPRASSSSGTRHTAAPSYLSPRSADVILSEVRPTRIKSDALRSVNVLLDELLWLILGYARSFSTERFRAGLLKILPTSLGKDALLEAEVELRAYIERNPPLSPLPADEPTNQNFPLQPAFELLRVKCEAYSSLGDQTENLEVESTLHSRMVQVAGDAAPKFSSVAPAALYLTAILEHICEHVLTNVGQVVARDSSRTTAHTQDLYIALCEDETIYSLFKTMKVHEQIKQQTKTPPPRRSKSISRNDTSIETTSEVARKPRNSLDSTASNSSNNNLPGRTSVDKGRTKGLFKNASSRSLAADSSNSNPTEAQARHRRSNSLLGFDKKLSSVPLDDTSSVTKLPPLDDDSTQDFDDLMRSGTTMKVSLTPDRLRTFEVYAKERANRSTNLPPPSSTSPPSSYSNGTSQHQKLKQSIIDRKRVESIAETPEDPVRSRSSSIASPGISKEEKPLASARARSLTETRVPTPRVENRSPFSSTKPPEPSEAVSHSLQNMPAVVIGPSTPLRKRAHHGVVHRPESVDLDDVMDGSDDDLPTAKKTPLTPKAAQATTSGARDLLDFLSEGPPEPPADVIPTSPTAWSNKGRFRTIVSRLTGSSSTERLTSRNAEEGSDIRRPAVSGINGGGVNPRPPPLTSKRSAPNFSIGSRPMPQSPSGVISSQPHDAGTHPPVPRIRQPSLTRKALPDWESRGPSGEKDELSPPPKPLPKPSEPMKPLPEFVPNHSAPVNSNPGSPSARKPVPATIEKSQDMFTQSAIGELQSPALALTNGHTKPDVSEATDTKSEQEPSKVALRPSSPSQCRTAVTTSSIPSEELVCDLRRLMDRATTANECRVLMEMFLAKCGGSSAKQDTPGPTTSPESPIPSEVESRHESDLIEVLLGDGPITLISVPAVPAPSPAIVHSHPPIDIAEEWNPERRQSSIITPTPPSMVVEAA